MMTFLTHYAALLIGVIAGFVLASFFKVGGRYDRDDD